MTRKAVFSEEERREKKLKLKRDWHARHKERNNARSRAYYLAHKEQRAQKMAEWRKANKERVRHLNTEYRKNNKEKCRKNQESWRKNNPDKVQVIQTRYAAKKLKTCPVFCLKNRMRVRMCQAIRSAGAYKIDRTLALIGCTSKQLKKHIESKFLPGMTWSNRKRWHVDHIVPIAAFDISTEEGQRAAFHYTNLQPLWAKDNLKKSSKRPKGQILFCFGYETLVHEQRSQARKGGSGRKGKRP